MDIIFLIGRILFGGFFLMSGFSHLKNMAGLSAYAASKGVPMPKLAVAASGLMILLGGAGVLLGIFPKISLILIALFLIPVSFKMHDYWKLEDPMQKMVQSTNFKKNMALLGAALIMLSLGLPWAYTLF